jgi:heterodisulfide reductase subunit A
MNNLQVDVVVLCTALIPPQDNRSLAETLGVKFDENGFFEVQHKLQMPLDATASGIFLCGCCQGPKDIPDSVAQAKGAAARVAEFIAQIGSMEAAR